MTSAPPSTTRPSCRISRFGSACSYSLLFRRDGRQPELEDRDNGPDGLALGERPKRGYPRGFQAALRLPISTVCQLLEAAASVHRRFEAVLGVKSPRPDYAKYMSATRIRNGQTCTFVVGRTNPQGMVQLTGSAPLRGLRDVGSATPVSAPSEGSFLDAKRGRTWMRFDNEIGDVHAHRSVSYTHLRAHETDSY